ncbi:hypothetical protein H6G93_04585 [Nostoc sp. FACHB-973]|nr:hypothetical protein [Nostoc sp. FACHB-973]
MSNSYTFGRKKAGTSTFSNPSLVSPHTPTLANPTGGFSLPTNNLIQTATEQSTNLKEAQSADEQSLLSEAVEQRSFSHDISRIALRRPQAKLTVGEPGDKYEQEADWMANQVMRMVVPHKLNTPTVQPVQDSLRRKCAACEHEEDKVQTKPSIQSANNVGLQARNNIESQLNSSKSEGSSLPDEVRSFMEAPFRTNFVILQRQEQVPASCPNREPDFNGVEGIINNAYGGSRSNTYSVDQLFDAWSHVRVQREKPGGVNCCSPELPAAEHYLYARYTVANRDYSPFEMKALIWGYGYFKFLVPKTGICPKSPDTQGSRDWGYRGADDGATDLFHQELA